MHSFQTWKTCRRGIFRTWTRSRCASCVHHCQTLYSRCVCLWLRSGNTQWHILRTILRSYPSHWWMFWYLVCPICWFSIFSSCNPSCLFHALICYFPKRRWFPLIHRVLTCHLESDRKLSLKIWRIVEFDWLKTFFWIEISTADRSYLALNRL